MAIILFEKLTSPILSSLEEKNNIIKWRMKCMLGILFFFFQFNFCSAQPSQIKRTWHWYFGNQAGIDFSSGTAVADTNGALFTREGCSSISDTAGNLQFYSDGRSVWNRNHQVMPNGIGILGGAMGSSSQQALIIPKPLSPNIYYLFTTDEFPGVLGMRYTMINMNLDGGLGDVDISQKNILLFAPCTEKLAAVNHCNDTSVWVLGHEINNNQFRAYLVTDNGINTNSVVSAVGTNMIGDWYGQMKFSPNGMMLALGLDTLLKKCEIYRFDNYTGQVFDPILLLDTIIPLNSGAVNIGITFSPDNSKLYVGRIATATLIQFDVSQYDSSLILNSRQTVGIGTGFRTLQNAPDGKIYINSYISNPDTMLSVINSPNLPGAACNFSFNSFSLLNRNATAGLSESNESYFDVSLISGCNPTSLFESSKSNFNIFPNPARDWIEVWGIEIKEISIYDVLGNLCYKAAGDFDSPKKININFLKDGIYLLKIKSANQNTTKKFFKH